MELEELDTKLLYISPIAYPVSKENLQKDLLKLISSCNFHHYILSFLSARSQISEKRCQISGEVYKEAGKRHRCLRSRCIPGRCLFSPPNSM